ncbi:MAG: DUF4835 domain-containing protein [Bacteroidetes bacterium GWC2_33_15]|nr:MAG: DUF4835 domain-containing protein [Bacteroidetes bacterium GWA2_33_15]OFX52127.1 MAG: DUF4835 domain-containing protein [Bacteroidetes bacterium GWC2_33_15]OFX64281.1 MAG: DUF4835 domain-containing protein [Bacteroidetes bacterium GWB2_32_14]OFX67686.1 MAG: DUF4835 domain-containing protein [Bacteroidetes bacterium GWD2_33_33]HAN19294.1 DUF4835 domain-containing protein [Bacteroidales bacterium]
MEKKFFVLIAFIFVSYLGIGQELRCNIQVVSSQIQGTNKQVFQTLQNELYEFMNNTAWTNHIYKNEERIDCNIMINLTDHSGDEFKGSIQIQSRRPVYNTSYNSAILNYKDDDVKFNYVEFEPLEFSLTEHRSNLTSILAYYAYIIIGFDYDTYSLLGGTEYFQKAEQIVNNAQNAAENGWKAFESRKNRYWLVENILNDQYKGVREFQYRFHRLGLDVMSSKEAAGRADIAESLELLQKVYRQKPDPFLFFYDMVMSAKSDELVNVFSESFMAEADRVYNILVEIDPSRSEKYKKIKEQ